MRNLLCISRRDITWQCFRFCLVFGYRTLGCTISDTLSGRYINISLLKKYKEVKEETSLPRSISLDMEFLKAFYRQPPFHTAYECFEEVMHGQTLCGLLVLQHQVNFLNFDHIIISI